MENLQCLTCIEKHKNKILKEELEHQKSLMEKIYNLINEFDDFSGESSVLGIEIKKIISEVLEGK